MTIMEKLKQSDCKLCADARFEIIKLEAEIMSLNRHLDRRHMRKASTTLRTKTAQKASQSAAGRALCQRVKV